MSRTSNDQYEDNKLINGYDYVNQAWVLGGKYEDCGHPQIGEYMPAIGSTFDGCNCYGRLHEGELAQAGVLDGSCAHCISNK